MNEFRLKLEKWSFNKHSRLDFTLGYGGWIKVKDLSLSFWNRGCFEAIGRYCGGLVSISTRTLNMLDVSEAIIQVEPNQCGLLPAFVELLPQGSRSFIIRISQDQNSARYMRPYSLFKHGNLMNSLDIARFQTVMEVERSFPLGFDVYSNKRNNIASQIPS